MEDQDLRHALGGLSVAAVCAAAWIVATSAVRPVEACSITPQMVDPEPTPASPWLPARLAHCRAASTVSEVTAEFAAIGADAPVQRERRSESDQLEQSRDSDRVPLFLEIVRRVALATAAQRKSEGASVAQGQATTSLAVAPVRVEPAADGVPVAIPQLGSIVVWLDVVEAGTDRMLQDVEVRLVEAREDWTLVHPGDGAFPVLAQAAESPVAVVATVTGRVGDGLHLLVGAPGYAWQPVCLDGANELVRVELRRGAELRLDLRDFDIDGPAILRLHRGGRSTPCFEQRIERLQPLLVNGLAPGPYVLSVESEFGPEENRVSTHRRIELHAAEG